jgi:opacity protein-like surface antigen
MIKLLVFLVLLFPLTSLAIIDKNRFYFKLNLSTNKLNGTKGTPYLSFPGGIGLGYYINNLHRIDITIENLDFNFHNVFLAYDKITDDTVISGSRNILCRAYGKSILFNNYYNIINKNDFKIFIGMGIGISKLKEKITNLFSGNMINGGLTTLPLVTTHYMSKQTTNFIYSFHIGTSININPVINVDLTYSYKNFGKTEYRKEDIQLIPSGKKYQGHQFSSGLRFDL